MVLAWKYVGGGAFGDCLPVPLPVFDRSKAAEYVMHKLDPVQLPPGGLPAALDGVARHAVYTLEYPAFAG